MNSFLPCKIQLSFLPEEKKKNLICAAMKRTLILSIYKKPQLFQLFSHPRQRLRSTDCSKVDILTLIQKLKGIYVVNEYLLDSVKHKSKPLKT